MVSRVSIAVAIAAIAVLSVRLYALVQENIGLRSSVTTLEAVKAESRVGDVQGSEIGAAELYVGQRNLQGEKADSSFVAVIGAADCEKCAAAEDVWRTAIRLTGRAVPMWHVVLGSSPDSWPILPPAAGTADDVRVQTMHVRNPSEYLLRTGVRYVPTSVIVSSADGAAVCVVAGVPEPNEADTCLDSLVRIAPRTTSFISHSAREIFLSSLK